MCNVTLSFVKCILIFLVVFQVQIAKTMVNRQFIFITPQDLSALKTDPLLKIHHMKPPARDGRVGGPSQQTLEFSQGSE